MPAPLTADPFAIFSVSPAAQERFVALSADRNPLHLPALPDRPDGVDRPVVHGIHTLLWGLDAIAGFAGKGPSPTSLRVRFEKTIHVEDRVAARVDVGDERRLRVDLARDGDRVATIRMTFGAAEPTRGRPGGPPRAIPHEPFCHAFADLAGFSASVALQRPPDLARCFPRAVGWLGETRAAALLTTSAVVGMLCPGLHSLYAGLDLAATDGGRPDGTLSVAVKDADDRFDRVQLALEGGGWIGTLDTLARRPRPA